MKLKVGTRVAFKDDPSFTGVIVDKFGPAGQYFQVKWTYVGHGWVTRIHTASQLVAL